MFVAEKMTFTDSHTHLYLDAFADDRAEMVRRAIDAGVARMLLPNIDDRSMAPMLELCNRFPANCFPMIGLHPTSVKDDYLDKMKFMGERLDNPLFVGVGESGIDLYWDKAHLKEQISVFETHIEWAKKRNLPLVIHARDSFQEIFNVLDNADTRGLRGVFHSFTGGRSELEKALSYGFMIGINGIVTFKNSRLPELVPSIPPDRLLLETDAPFLAPHPFRGKRNESSHLVHIASRIGEILNLTLEEIGELTHKNAGRLFNINKPDGRE